MDRPNYYSILSADVRYDNRLTDSEKLLYAEITALSNKTGECWASNTYFAELYNVTIVTISRRISKLKELNYIDTKMVYKPNSKEIDKRIITLRGINNSDKGYYHDLQGGINNSDKGGINRIDKDNNTSIEYYKKNNKPYSPFGEYTDNPELLKTLLDFESMRKQMKSIMTDRAKTLLLTELNKLASSDKEKIDLLNQSIMNGWKSVYPLKNQKGAKIDSAGKFNTEQGF